MPLDGTEEKLVYRVIWGIQLSKSCPIIFTITYGYDFAIEIFQKF
jgi:hypothetical protein